jgi:peptide-methionine (R)-S-oxide reductase
MIAAERCGGQCGRQGAFRQIMDRFTLSETEWRKRLSPDQYGVLREGANEAPFTGRYDNNRADGLYRCAGCATPLFDSADKFDATCGYACFTQPIAADRVGAHGDTGSGAKRMEARCTRCDGHLAMFSTTARRRPAFDTRSTRSAWISARAARRTRAERHVVAASLQGRFWRLFSLRITPIRIRASHGPRTLPQIPSKDPVAVASSHRAHDSGAVRAGRARADRAGHRRLCRALAIAEFR